MTQRQNRCTLDFEFLCCRFSHSRLVPRSCILVLLSSFPVLRSAALLPIYPPPARRFPINGDNHSLGKYPSTLIPHPPALLLLTPDANLSTLSHGGRGHS